MEMDRCKLSSGYAKMRKGLPSEDHLKKWRRMRRLPQFTSRERHSLASGPGSSTESGKEAVPMTDAIPFKQGNKG